MLVLAANVVFLPLISLSIGVVGLGGLIFTAMRFRRDDTTAIVTQQSAIFDDLKKLNEELRATSDGLREERDHLQHRVDNLSGQIEALRRELRESSAQQSGKLSKIQKKLDDAS